MPMNRVTTASEYLRKSLLPGSEPGRPHKGVKSGAMAFAM
jgi:hypothetical protein